MLIQYSMIQPRLKGEVRVVDCLEVKDGHEELPLLVIVLERPFLSLRLYLQGMIIE